MRRFRRNPYLQKALAMFLTFSMVMNMNWPVTTAIAANQQYALAEQQYEQMLADAGEGDATETGGDTSPADTPPAQAADGASDDASATAVSSEEGTTASSEHASTDDAATGQSDSAATPDTADEDDTQAGNTAATSNNTTDAQDETTNPQAVVEGDANAQLEDEASNTWTVTFYNRDADEYKTVEVAKGEAIGSQLPDTIAREDYNAYWAVGKIVDGAQGTEIKKTGDRIDATWVPTADTIIVPDYEKITYTVTFYSDAETGTVTTTKTVNVDTSYCLNDIPAVPAKPGYTGKWVYDDGDFTNNVTIKSDMAVWAVYEQNVFTVTFVVDGNVYQADSFYAGDKLTLPSDPVVTGKDFVAWVDTAGNDVSDDVTVTSNMTLTARFSDQNAVSFIVRNGDTETERLSQYFRASGEEIGTLPQDPFVSGKVFEGWYVDRTNTKVTADTVVTGPMTVVAKFRDIEVYNITAEYYYLNDGGNEVVFNTDLIAVETDDLPYTITAPASTQTAENEVKGGPVYYASTPTVTVQKEDFDAERNHTVRIEYVEHTAEYDYVYMLQDLNGNGYTEVKRVHVLGVLNSTVTPTVENIDGAIFERADAVEITDATGQEVRAYYTRKSYSVSYDTMGGTYVPGSTQLYGAQYELTSEQPTRNGYEFKGWYTDPACTTQAGSAIEIKGDTTLYAKWEGKNVNYTIVYMFEKYNDAGTESSYVYDNSDTGTAKVGTTVQASSAPTITKTGWEIDTARNANSSVVVAADGSSVLYVYYKLTTYTFTFDLGNYPTYRMTIGGTTYYNAYGSTRYSFTAKLGQDVSGKWPMNGGNATIWDSYNWATYSFYGWQGSNTNYTGNFVTKQIFVTNEMLPKSGTNATYTGQWDDTVYEFAVNYWLQNADDDGYTVSEQYSQTYYSKRSTANLVAKEIVGYTKHNNDASAPAGYEGSGNAITAVTQSNNGNYVRDDNKSDRDATYYEFKGHFYRQRKNQGDGNKTRYNVSFKYTSNFYYDRNTYQIEYVYSGNELKTISDIKFDANINSNTYYWAPTARQCSVDSDYTFDGWYADSGLTSKYTFGTMPASNLVLYAKWNASSYEVSFIDADGGEQLAPTQTVEKYKKATAPETSPTKAGYVFDGWYTSAEGDTLFDWNNQITADTTVYAHWTRTTLSYSVRYVDDTEAHAEVAPAKVVTNPNLEVGQEVTEEAIAVAGYRPTTNSASLTLKGTSNDNVVTFVYSKKADEVTYTVRYVIADGELGAGTEVHEAKKPTTVPGDTATVIESAAAVDYSRFKGTALEGLEFYPTEVEKTLVLSSEKEQTFTFYYSSYKHANVTVHYVDMDGNKIADDTTEILKVGNTFTLSRTPIVDWVLNKAVKGNAYSDNVASTAYKITNDNAENGLEFTLYYQRRVTVTAISDSKQYDGDALMMPEGVAAVTVDGLPETEQLTSIELSYVDADNETDNGRINAGTAKVTPIDAKTNGDHQSPDYYFFRYISGTLTVSKINVTIRNEPDRWTGATYTGKPYLTGFTNGSKGVADYIMISNDTYAELYRNTIWNKVASLENVQECGLGS